MRIAINLDISSSVDTTIARVTEVRERGFNATWSSQIFGPDTLTVLAVVGLADLIMARRRRLGRDRGLGRDRDRDRDLSPD